MLKKYKITGFSCKSMLFIGSILLSPLFAFSQGITLTDNPLEGRKIFESKGCIKCHAIHGVGGDIGPDLGKDPNIQGSIEIAAAMWNHSPAMTEEMKRQYYSRPSFTKSELEKLYTFLYYLSYLQTGGNEERGKRVFKQRGCVRCHSTENSQSGVGPALEGLSYFVSPLFLIQALWNHGRKMEELMEKMQISRPVLSENDLLDIACYLRSINRTSKQELQFASPGNPSDGEKVFIENKCALCHSLKDHASTIGPDLRRAEYNQSVSQIGAVVWNHAPEMWKMMKENNIEIPELVDREVADLIAFIYFLKFLRVEGNAQNGKKVFAEKECITCHEVGGEGGNIGPSISEMTGIRSVIEFSGVIWNHAPIMERYMSENNIPWPVFNANELADIFIFLKDITKH